ncbi:hypothetical protein [uncultured Arcobacter sp.]|uniref:hypothetical protein n=1 Tax=uncultured Arcobacter sp. TaxID=165434 RepID=UPI002631ACEE|nr:hypothetical protein [uncultured Arcobacter sp.]
MILSDSQRHKLFDAITQKELKINTFKFDFKYIFQNPYDITSDDLKKLRDELKKIMKSCNIA